MPIPIVLKVFRGGDLVRTEQFNREIIKIGRIASAHLCLHDEKISRIHSAIAVSPDGSISIIDMGSSEGTFVNGNRVSRGPLRHGDQVMLGGLTIVVESPGGDGPPASGKGAPGGVAPEPRAEPPPAPAPAAEAPRRPKLRPASAAIEDVGDGSDLGVELRIAWGDALLQAETFVRPKAPVLVGETPRCTMRLEGLPVSELPVLRWEDGEYRFTFARGMTGVVEEKGTRTPFSDLVESHEAVVDDMTEGAYSIAIPRTGAVRAEVGSGLAIETRSMKLQSVKAASFWKRINYQSVNLFLVLSFLQAAFVVAANNFPYDTDVVADDLLEEPSRLARFVIELPEPQPRQAGQQKEEEKLTKWSEKGAKHRGEEGRMGQKDAPRTAGRSRPRAIDLNAEHIAKDLGLVGLLRRGAELSTVFGSGGLGGDLRATVGNMSGPVVADSDGLGGLGIRGSGTGAGGQDDSLGIGAIGTKGLGRGIRDQGSLNIKKGMHEPIADIAPEVRGSVDKELIRKVIQDHAAQIRYCYEQQLAINPRLQGKVTITWTIEGDGSATNPKVDGSATTLADSRVRECMMSRITSWTFPRPMGGGVAIITYPWILRSSGGQ